MPRDWQMIIMDVVLGSIIFFVCLAFLLQSNLLAGFVVAAMFVFVVVAAWPQNPIPRI